MSPASRPVAGLLAVVAAASSVVVGGPSAVGAATWRLPPARAAFDYQLGGAYPPARPGVVVRDWFDGRALTGAGNYSVCYVNGFQTQPDDVGNRPDATSRWPRSVVLAAQDPDWPGEHFVDIGTAAKRATASRHVATMVAACKRKGFVAVEFDNLDSWTRVPTGAGGAKPFGRSAAIAYAKLLVVDAHANGLAVAQKNTPEITGLVPFDFVLSEECGQYGECRAYEGAARYYSRGLVFDVEYVKSAYTRACTDHGRTISVIRRDRNLAPKGGSGYVFTACRAG